MNLKAVLQQLNGGVIEQLFKGPAWHNGNPEEIAHYFIREIPKQWGKLNLDEQKVLIYFLFCAPGQSLSYRQMDVVAKSHSPYAIYQGLTGLRQKGIIYTHRHQWGEMAFFIPEDVASCFRQFLWNSYSLPGAVLPNLNGEKELPVLCDVLFLILQTYRYQPIPLTKKGELSARVRRFWKEMIPYPEELFVPLNCGKEEWFFSFLEDQGLMVLYENERGKFLAVHEEHVAQLFEGNQRQIQKRLYEAIKRIYTQSHSFFTLIFEAVEMNQWQPCWDKIVQQVGMEPVGSEWEEFTRKILPLLQAFGCLQLEEEETRWIEKTGYVQPTFEVLLMPNAAYGIRWALGNFARLIQQQELWTFQLDKETITQVQCPDTKETLLILLRNIQGGPLPENVVQQIHKWIEATEEVTLENVILLRCSSKLLADRLASARVNGLGQKINETLFLVQETALPLLQKELNKMEIQLKENSEEKRVTFSRKHENREESITVESIYPMLEDVLPEVKELPSLWRKNRQKYHASTLRMFMEKASILGLPIHMEAKDKEWEGIVIRRLLQKQGMEMVYFTDGVKEYAIPLTEIGPIQIQV